MIMIIICFFLWIIIDVMVTGTLITWLQLFRKQILCNLQYMYPPIYFCQYGDEFPNVWEFLRCHPKDITNVAFHRSYPLFASCSDDCTAYVFHGMVYSDLNQNPLIVPLEILRGHTSSNGRGENFQDLLFILSGGWVWKWRFKKEQPESLKKKKKQRQCDWFYYFLFTGKSWRHLIKYSHYIRRTHTYIDKCVFLY